MLKNHKLISLCIGLLFVIVLQTFAAPLPVFRFLLPAFLLYCALVALYNRWYLKQSQQYNFWSLIRPLLLMCAAFGVFLAVPSEGLRGAYLIACALVITLFEVTIKKQAENILLNQTLLTAFGIFFALFAGNYYTPQYGPLYLAASFFASALLARGFYQLLPQSNKVKTAGAIILGLFCAQIFWLLNFLPFHYSVLCLLLFNFFYLCLILNYYYLFHILNFKKIQFHLFFMLVCGAIVLLSTPWRIVA